MLILDLLTGVWTNLLQTGGTSTQAGTGPYTLPGNSLLTNGGFEGASGSSLNGWTSTNNNFEIWKNGFNNVYAQEGKTLIEIDAERGVVSQSVTTEANKVYNLTFDFTGRPGYVASSKMDILWNDKVVATVTPTDDKWKKYGLAVTGTGNDRLSFRSVTGDNDTVGGLLDNVALTADMMPLPNGRSADIEYLNFDAASTSFLRNMVQTGAYRTVSGHFNNENNPEFGSSGEAFTRLTFADYGENGAPRGVINGVQTETNERLISNVIANQDENGDGVEEKTRSLHNTNLFLMSFGQFFDHGLDFIDRSSNPADKYVIPLSPNDPLYRFSDDGNPFNDITSMRITRGAEAIDPNTGQPFAVRSHTNKTSPFIDQNQTYGSSDAVSYYLRQSATDANGNVIYDADGSIVKLATLKNGALDPTGRYNLPTYRDILINNGMSVADIDAAVAANSFAMLQSAKGFVDFRNVIDPKTGQPDGNPLLLDISFDSEPDGRAFNMQKLLSNYVAGDGRVNENIALTPIHTVFHRDHDHWVEVIRAKTGNTWTEEEYFQTAKSIVEFEYQRVIFDEFIDAMAGSLPGPIPHGFDGYHPRVDAQISEEFAHAIYRVGHSMINERIPFTTSDGSLKNMSLVEAFLNPGAFATIGSDALIDGSTRVAHERIDENLVNAVRNQLLGVASDLAAINIARGREVGLPTLNDVRRALYNNGSSEVVNGSDVTRALKGNEELKPYANWDEFASKLRDPSLVNLFKQVYATVDDVDLWIGGLAEKPRSAEEGQMGTTFTWIFWEQMDRLQDGDRFYYKGRFSDTEILGMLETQTFADIIMRTTGEEFLNDKVFFLTQKVYMGATETSRTTTDADETVIGNALNNNISAGKGNDTVYAQAGNDTVRGGDGDDGLRGEDGNDYLYGDKGEDRLVGGEGNDYLYGGDDQDALNGNQGDDYIYGENGDDEVHGNEGNDRLSGGAGNDVIKGGIGNDTIYGDAGNDVIETNGGDDQVWTGGDFDVVLMSDDRGKVRINDFDVNKDRIDMRLFGVTNFDQFKAKVALFDTAAGAVLKVGESEILLAGRKVSNLTMDNIKFGNNEQNLVINGRMDERRIKVSNGEISLDDHLGSNSWAYVDNERSTGWKNAADSRVEYVRVRGNEALEIDVDNKVDEIYQDLPTRAGEVYKLTFDSVLKDTTAVGSGTVQVLWNGNVVATFDPSRTWTTRTFQFVGTGGMDRLSFREEAGDNNGYGALIDNVVVAPADGQPEKYELTGNSSDNLYKDIIGLTEFIDGKDGTDTYQVSTSARGYTVSRDANGVTTVSLKGQALAWLKNIEVIKFNDSEFRLEGSNWVRKYVGGDGNDTINGGASNDVMEGLGGNDTLFGSGGDDAIYGGDGNDSLRGGAGADTIDGGAGIDTVSYAGSTGPVIVDLVAGRAYNNDGAGDVLISIENIVGSSFGDILQGGIGGNIIDGGAGDDLINGGLGADILFGGSGNDTIDYGGSGGALTINLQTSKASGGEASNDLISGFENVNATAYDDSITGSSVANVLVGNAGADTIYGMGGDDRLIGGEGIDNLFGGTGKDVFVLQPNGAHYDIINDFVSVDDQVEISASLFGLNLLPGFLTGKQAIANTTGLATDGGDATTRFIYNTATGGLFFDADGTGAGGGARIATFLNNPVVGIDDITIVK